MGYKLSIKQQLLTIGYQSSKPMPTLNPSKDPLVAKVSLTAPKWTYKPAVIRWLTNCQGSLNFAFEPAAKGASKSGKPG
ncbi:hypothetical protein [Cyclobacterium plantarum]|uniref:Uncharacterized protein n=1 Tax=Cyclobacterium plantarum TaxID=2716263 RepID=A0ABX0H7E8_9BACT|nr:hypothetical protein [Cyclobacterium plantarum]NHE56269.1 hypothetical protein [Cyclobacterium plantarum]